MHSPDGFYSVGLCLAMDAICLGVIAYCVKRVWGKLSRDTVLLAASAGAFIFAIELANISVTKGSSCHFMGGVFTAIALGPFLGALVAGIMHLVQFLIFQDGGLLSLGPNLFNIAIISAFIGYYLYRSFKTLIIEPYGTYVGAFISTWLTLLITSITVCIMLSISGVDSFWALLGPMTGPHVLIGVIEGVITVLLLGVMEKLSPGFLCLSKGSPEGLPVGHHKSQFEKIWHFLPALAIFVGVFVSPFAYRSLEGMEKLVMDGRFFEGQEVVFYHAPLPDYEIPGIGNERIGDAVAGVLGALITFGACLVAGKLFTRKEEKIEAGAELRGVVNH
ncbi:energy-coupling factor ABC transporter permease [bacterium]|nr:energy-coupling factor ABC transporter permease [bacterium]